MKEALSDETKAITTPDYWEDAWAGASIPDPIDPHDMASENHYYRTMHALFLRTLHGTAAPESRLIEIGCGGSRWLPYFHRMFGYDVAGIDYTQAGTDLSQAILAKAGVRGQIVRGDLFTPPPDWIGQFDVVASFGLIEHFEDTAQIVSACARYLRPGGQMISLVPTMHGLYGLAYRLLRPNIYRMHIPQNRGGLAQAHRDAGLTVTHCSYVLGLPAMISAPPPTSLIGSMAFVLSRWYWNAEQAGWGLPPNRFTSPYALCISTKSSHVPQ